MIKKLSPMGDGLGLVLDRQILELLGITQDTPLELTTDGAGLRICPAKQASKLERVLAAADEVMAAHDATFRKLAL